MESTLDISNLIEKTEEFVYDPRMEMADEGEAQIQIIEKENGKKYQLSVKMKLLPN